MADTKISALTAIASLAAEDLYAVVDDPSGTPATTKATHTQLATLMKSLLISDTAYDATSWNAVTDIAPSKNAVRDQIEAIIALLASDTAFASSWDGVTTIPPSKNAVYDQLVKAAHPGYAAAQWIIVPRSGYVAGQALVANTVYYTPFWLPRPITISDFGVRVTSAIGGSNIRVAVYASSGTPPRPSGSPLAQIDAALSGASIATVSGDIRGANVTLTGPDLFWAAVWSDAAPTINGVTNDSYTDVGDYVGITDLALWVSSRHGVGFTSAETFGTDFPNATSETITEASPSANRLLIAMKAA